MRSFIKKRYFYNIIAVGSILLFLRFYNISWGAPYFFHPDERNIASSITKLHFPDQLNPHFFAYGSLPIYSIYFIGVLQNYSASLFKITLSNADLYRVSFENAILVSRFFSAFFSVGLVFLLFKISQRLTNTSTAYITALLAIFSIGFIQYAHFGTFEMWLAFFLTALFYTLILFLDTKHYRYYAISCVLTAILIAIKISSLIFIVFPLLTLLLSIFSNKKTFTLYFLTSITRVLASYLLLIMCIAIIYSVSSPYTFLDYKSFQGSIQYESSVALGTLPVFYTQSFKGTIPIIFQIVYVYPFLINPFLVILFILSFCIFIFYSFKKKDYRLLLLLSFFLITFLSQGILYVKWTRYLIPTLPFVYLIITTTLSLIRKTKQSKQIINSIYFLTIFLSIIYSFAFVYVVYIQPDTRIAASDWVRKNIPFPSQALAEVYDMGIVPFNDKLSNITLYNFYDLDTQTNADYELKSLLSTHNYIIIESQRIIRSRLLYPNLYPKGHAFYSDLLTNTHLYTKIYQTPCNLWCRMIYMGNPITSLEETTSVFDRPSIMIFKKI